MITIGLFICSWLVFCIWGDKERFPELFPSSLFACYLGLFTDLVMEKYELWSYRDPPLGREGVTLLLDFGVYVVAAYLFLQYSPKVLKGFLVYTFFWVTGSILLEFFYLKVGIMDYHKWWNLMFSFFADWIIYFLFFLQYRFYANKSMKRLKG